MVGSQDKMCAKAASSRRALEAPHHIIDSRRVRDADARRMARIGWLVAGGLTLVTGIVLTFVMSTHEGRRPQSRRWGEARDELLAEFLAEIRSVDLTNEEAIKSAKQKILASSWLWKGTHIEEEVANWLGKVNSGGKAIIKTRNLKEKLAGIEAHLASNPPIDVLGWDFREVRSPDLMMEADQAPPDVKARFNSVAKHVAQKYIEVLRAAANASASATTGEGLQSYGPLEDTIRTMLHEARAHKNAEAEAIYQPMWKQTYNEVNGIVSKLFNEAYQSRVEWKNLLTDTLGWTFAASSSFKHTFGAGLSLVNVPGEQSGAGGLSYTPADKWRDYVLEVEFKLDSGTLVFYTRIRDRMDAKEVPAFSVGTKDSTIRIEYGKTYTLVISTIGNKLTVTGEGISHAEDIEYTKSRKGEPGIVALAGTTATITGLRARHLR